MSNVGCNRWAMRRRGWQRWHLPNAVVVAIRQVEVEAVGRDRDAERVVEARGGASAVEGRDARDGHFLSCNAGRACGDNEHTR